MLLLYQPIFFLICLPAGLTFVYYKERLDAEPIKLQVEAVSNEWQSAAGIYLRNNQGGHGSITFSMPLDPFYAVEGPTAYFINGSKTEEFSCLHHSSRKVKPICRSNTGTKLEGDYFVDTDGSLLVKITRMQSSRQSSRDSSFKNWRLLTQEIPATSLLISLNVALAYVYWDRRVDPTAVAKVYDSMVHQPFEIWRSFTGATAHFSLWHLGLNMMSFMALGKEVEARLSSLVFMYYNVSLVPIVTVVWLSLQWLGARYFHRGNQQRSPTVGYSGVLFAWMVVASLEQSETCPVIFFPSLCFKTYQFGVFRFSFGPVVQLLVMQVMLPRVSFYGHLAGIVAGFLIHWGLLPIRLVQPSVLIPVLHCLYLQFFRKISFKPAITTGYNLRPFARLCLVCQLAILLMSAYASKWDDFVAHGLTGLWWIMVQTPESDFSERQVLTKATTVAAVLGVVSDSVKLGFLLAFHALTIPNAALLIARVTVLFWMLISCGISDLDAEDGVFERVLCFSTLNFCRSVEVSSVAAPARSILPTSEEGHRLGGSPISRNGDRPLSRLV